MSTPRFILVSVVAAGLLFGTTRTAIAIELSYASLTDPYWRRLVRAGRWPGLLVAREIAAPNAP